MNIVSNEVRRSMIGAALRHAFFYAPAVPFQQEWHNGTGYLDAATKTTFDAPVVKTTDQYGRRVVIINNGDSSIVLFDRYQPSETGISKHFAANWIGSVRYESGRTGQVLFNADEGRLAEQYPETFDKIINACKAIRK